MEPSLEIIVAGVSQGKADAAGAATVENWMGNHKSDRLDNADILSNILFRFFKIYKNSAQIIQKNLMHLIHRSTNI